MQKQIPSPDRWPSPDELDRFYLIVCSRLKTKYLPGGVPLSDTADFDDIVSYSLLKVCAAYDPGRPLNDAYVRRTADTVFIDWRREVARSREVPGLLAEAAVVCPANDNESIEPSLENLQKIIPLLSPTVQERAKLFVQAMAEGANTTRSLLDATAPLLEDLDARQAEEGAVRGLRDADLQNRRRWDLARVRHAYAEFTRQVRDVCSRFRGFVPPLLVLLGPLLTCVLLSVLVTPANAATAVVGTISLVAFVAIAMLIGRSLLSAVVGAAVAIMVIGLVAPLVSMARERNHQVQCQNNLKLMGVACHFYLDSHRAFPRARVDPKEFGALGGWQTDILWHMNPPEGTFTQDGGVKHAKRIIGYECPADYRLNYSVPTVAGLTSYCGVSGAFGRLPDAYTTEDAGVFQPDRRVRIIDIEDGWSNTLMIGERPPSSDWKWGRWGYSDYDNVLASENHINMYSDCGSPGTYRPGLLDDPCSSNRFWSLHPGGSNWAFADGSVRFLSYDTQPIINKLATRAGHDKVDFPPH